LRGQTNELQSCQVDESCGALQQSAQVTLRDTSSGCEYMCMSDHMQPFVVSAAAAGDLQQLTVRNSSKSGLLLQTINTILPPRCR
jgi:hypothetical protein